MTHVAPAHAADHEARPRRGRQLVIAALAVVVLAVVVLLAAWPALASYDAAQVRPYWLGPPTCRGAEVDLRQEPTIVAEPGMQCVVRLVIPATGSRGARIR